MKINIIICLLLICLTVNASPGLGRLSKNYKDPLFMPMRCLSLTDESDLDTSGDTDNSFWVVLSDRDNNPTYKSKNCQIPSDVTVNFMDAFYVCDYSDYAIALVKDELKDGSFSKKAEFYGWIPKAKLIMSPLTLKNSSGITRKGLIINRIDNLQNVLDPDYILSLALKTSPDPNGVNYEQSNVFSIYPILKTNINDSANNLEPEWFLLYTQLEIFSRGKLSEVEKNNKKYALGWIHKNSLTTWDTRIALEPNWDINSVRQRREYNWPAVIFKGDQEARTMNFISKSERADFVKDIRYSYTSTDPYQDIDLDQTSISEILENNRPEGKIFRIPRLEYIGNYDNNHYLSLYDVGFIGDVTTRLLEENSYKAGTSISAELEAELRDKLLNKKENLSNVDIVFVVDGTNSMEAYLKAVKESITKIMQNLTEDNKTNFRFGGVIYRDKDDYIPHPQKLTSNISKITDYFTTSATSNQSPYPELMYQGLIDGMTKTGLNKNHFNLLILIGDCGNHRLEGTETNGQVEKKIANYLVSYNCNFIAYQVAYHSNSKGKQSSTDFIDQNSRIATSLYNNNPANSIYPETNISYLLDDGISLKTPDAHLIATIFPWTSNKQRSKNNLETLIIDDFAEYRKTNLDIINYIENMLRGNSNIDSPAEGDRDISNLTKAYFQQDIAEGNERSAILASLFENNIERFQMYVTGTIQNKFILDNGALSEPVFRDVILLGHDELATLVSALDTATSKTINQDNPKNIRVANVWIEFINLIIGGFSESEKQKFADLNERTIGELVEISFGARSTSEFANVSIEEIKSKNPENKTDIEFLDSLLNHLQEKSNELKQNILYNPDYKYSIRLDDKMSKYYWISVDALP